VDDLGVKLSGGGIGRLHLESGLLSERLYQFLEGEMKLAATAA
jgi:hypothetical protein